MKFRALTDLYLGDGRYIQAGDTFDVPSSFRPPTHACDPLDPDAMFAYWSEGPRFSEVEIWRATFTNGNRWSDKPVSPPTTWWVPVNVKNKEEGYVLNGGSNLGPQPPM